MDNISAADVGAVVGNRGNGWGDGMGGGFWIFALIVLAFMGNGFGGYGNRGGNAVTEADLCNANSFNELKSSVGRGFDQQSQFAFQNQRDMCQTTATLSAQIAENRYAQQQCCCETKALISQEAAATRAMIQQDKIECMQQKINNLEADIRMQGVIRYPQGFCYSASNPFFGGSSCGCNNVLF